MSKLDIDRDIKISGHLFEAGTVETEIDGVDYKDMLEDIMANTTKSQAEAVAHHGEKKL